MNILQKNKNIIIASVVAILFIVGLIIFLAKPLYNKVQEQKDMGEQSKQKLDDTKVEGQKWQEYKKQRERIEENQKLLENSSISNETQINLIESLEKIAEEEGVIIEIQSQDSVNFDKKKSSSNKKDDKKESSAEEEVFFALTLDGEYNEILDYLYKLENFNYILSISSINIKTRSTVPTLREQIKEEGNQKSLQAKIVISFIPQK